MDDTLAELGRKRREGQTLVGFAAETENLRENAERKLREKGLQFIALNDVTQPGAGFAGLTNQIHLLDDEEHWMTSPLLSKRELADWLIDRVRRVKMNLSETASVSFQAQNRLTEP